MKKYITLILLLFIVNLKAMETALIGGGGEPSGATTIFDESLKEFGEAKKRIPMDLHMAFNGGHGTTQTIIQSDIKTENSEFTKEHFENLIKSYIDKIKSGGIKSGEKLLVIIDTHGGEQEDDIQAKKGEKGNNLKTHPIALGGANLNSYDHLRTDTTVSMSNFENLTKVAAEYNIKLGIIDFSCHSGNSLVLANKNTCVISASGPNSYAYSSFPTNFYKEMLPGRSLEDVFLNARKNENSPSFPMISTNVGRKVGDKEYGLFGPYLKYRSMQNGMPVDKLSTYLKSLFQGDNLCRREINFQKLIDEINNYQKITGKISGEDALIDELKSYKKMQDDYFKDLKDLEYPLLETKVKITYSSGRKDKKGKIIKKEEVTNWKDIMTGYSMSNVDYFKERLAVATEPSVKTDLLEAIDKYNKISEIREMITSKHPGLLKMEDFYKRTSDYDGRQWEKTVNISKLANKLYDFNYQVEKQSESDNSEPCRDFKL